MVQKLNKEHTKKLFNKLRELVDSGQVSRERLTEYLHSQARGGRPKTVKPQDKKVHFVVMRFSQVEILKLKESAHKRRSNVSELIRGCLKSLLK